MLNLLDICFDIIIFLSKPKRIWVIVPFFTVCAKTRTFVMSTRRYWHITDALNDEKKCYFQTCSVTSSLHMATITCLNRVTSITAHCYDAPVICVCVCGGASTHVVCYWFLWMLIAQALFVSKAMRYPAIISHSKRHGCCWDDFFFSCIDNIYH